MKRKKPSRENAEGERHHKEIEVPPGAKVGYIEAEDGHLIQVVMLPPDGEEAVNRRLRTILDLAIAIGRRQGKIRSNIGNSMVDERLRRTNRMAIKGVSDVVRLPRLGKIRLGIKQEGDPDRMYPTPTDYFVCPEEVKKVFGDKPKELKIMFPTEDETQWATQYLKCYSAMRGLICRGDGEMAIARIDIATGRIATRETSDTDLREMPCNPETCTLYQQARCRRVMSLQFLIPDCPGFGVYQLNTSSFYSIVNVNSSIKLIRSICQRVSMIPLTLKLVPQEVQPHGQLKTVYVLKLTVSHTLAEIQKYAQVPPSQALILPPPDSEVPDDLFPQEILEQESRCSISEIPTAEEVLLQVWHKVKKQLKKREVQSAQVSLWFDQFHNEEVNLSDFEAMVPPARFTIEILSHFYDALVAYEEKLKQEQQD